MSGGDLVPRGEDSFGVSGLRTGPTGVIDWPTYMTYKDWDDLGMVVCEARDFTAWVLGDWLLYGESKWNSDEYAQAQALTGRSYGGLRNLRWVADRFPLHRRRETLTWSHHRAVAGIKDDAVQEEWLDRAEAGWSVDLLESSLRDVGLVSPRDDSTRMERDLRDAPLEQVEHALTQLPPERQKAIAAAAGHEHLKAIAAHSDDVDVGRIIEAARAVVNSRIGRRRWLRFPEPLAASERQGRYLQSVDADLLEELGRLLREETP